MRYAVLFQQTASIFWNSLHELPSFLDRIDCRSVLFDSCHTMGRLVWLFIMRTAFLHFLNYNLKLLIYFAQYIYPEAERFLCFTRNLIIRSLSGFFPLNEGMIRLWCLIAVRSRKIHLCLISSRNLGYEDSHTNKPDIIKMSIYFTHFDFIYLFIFYLCYALYFIWLLKALKERRYAP